MRFQGLCVTLQNFSQHLQVTITATKVSPEDCVIDAGATVGMNGSQSNSYHLSDTTIAVENSGNGDNTFFCHNDTSLPGGTTPMLFKFLSCVSYASPHVKLITSFYFSHVFPHPGSTFTIVGVSFISGKKSLFNHPPLSTTFQLGLALQNGGQVSALALR